MPGCVADAHSYSYGGGYSHTDRNAECFAYVRAERVPGADRVFGYRRAAEYAAKPDIG